MGNESIIRLGMFFGVFAMLALLETLSPRRPLSTAKPRRWFINLVILILNPLLVRLVFPVLPVGIAILAAKQHWGLLNSIDFPDEIKRVVGVILLDLAIYLQHVLFHAVPAFWRLHMVHHADLDFDVTTGLRFHPIEILLSMAIKVLVISALGPPPMAVLVFEVVLNAASMFNHSNIRIPVKIDRMLRLFIVTPDMHRIHHSVIINETNSNYGFGLSWWDRLFGTYKDQPDEGHTGMTIGLSQFQGSQGLSLPKLLFLPFTGDPGRVPINRR